MIALYDRVAHITTVSFDSRYFIATTRRNAVVRTERRRFSTPLVRYEAKDAYVRRHACGPVSMLHVCLKFKARGETTRRGQSEKRTEQIISYHGDGDEVDDNNNTAKRRSVGPHESMRTLGRNRNLLRISKRAVRT